MGILRRLEVNSKQLKNYVKVFNNVTKPKQVTGDAYYKTKNIAIMEREKSFFAVGKGVSMKDCTKANNLLASNFTRILVDQKVQYSINKKMTIEGLDHVDEKKFKKTVGKLGRNASNEIYGVLQWYVQDGELKNKILPSQQCILIMNEEDNEVLENVLRVYKDGEDEYIDVIDKTGTETFKLVKDDYVSVSFTYHLRKNTVSGGNAIDSTELAWSVVPVSVLYNNDINQTDLQMFKSYVDAYDFANSDFFNNLEDFQEMYWVLKGYNGQNAEEFMEEFKRSRILKVGEGGDASQVAQEVPYQARETALNIAKHDIYRFGMGVDPESIKGDTTNVTIKALFSNLDLKANQFEDQIDQFIADSVDIINSYANITNKSKIEDYTVTYNRETIINKESLLNTLKELGINISNETLLKNAPIVEDVDAELALIEANEKKRVDELGGMMGFGDE